MRRGLLLAAVLATGLAATPAPVPPSPDAPAEVATRDQVTGLLGHRTLSADGTELGRIVDVLVDASGLPRGVVIDVGGFMGLGNRKVAVAWRALSFSSGKDGPVVSVKISSERIRLGPEVLPGKPIVMLDTPAPGSSH